MSFFMSKYKGGSAIIMSMVSLGVMASIAYGISKMHELNFAGIRASHFKIQADQYAQDRASVLRSMDFDSVVVMSRQPVPGTASSGENEDTYYEEVVVDSSDTGVYKQFRINIYKGRNSNDVLSSVVIRKTNPGFLVDNQLAGLDEKSDKKSLTSEASHSYAGTRFGETIDSLSDTSAMSASTLKTYVSSVLADYVKASNAVKHNPGSGVGSFSTPVYVAADGFVKMGNVTTRMSLLGTGDKIPVLTKEGNIYYIDYIAKSDFFVY